MNIFFLDRNPQIAAQSLHDVHLRKMIVESAQLLCSAHHLSNTKLDKSKLYKLTHKNHPMAIWTRECNANYQWLLEYSKELIREFEYRFDKSHKTSSIINYLDVDCSEMLDNTSLTISNPPLCMPEIYHQDDFVEAYRSYYCKAKKVDKNGKSISKYTKRSCPDFFG